MEALLVGAAAAVALIVAGWVLWGNLKAKHAVSKYNLHVTNETLEAVKRSENVEASIRKLSDDQLDARMRKRAGKRRDVNHSSTVADTRRPR